MAGPAKVHSDQRTPNVKIKYEQFRNDDKITVEEERLVMPYRPRSTPRTPTGGRVGTATEYGFGATQRGEGTSHSPTNPGRLEDLLVGD